VDLKHYSIVLSRYDLLFSTEDVRSTVRERRTAKRKLSAEKSNRVPEVETEKVATEEKMQASVAGTKEVFKNDKVEKSAAIEVAEEGVKGDIEIESDSLKFNDELCLDETYFNDDSEHVAVNEVLIIPEKRNKMKDENVENLSCRYSQPF
jgi:hypothetical protein